MRWFESYLIGTDVGHIPVSNLYEVFVLFCWFTALFYLYFEERYAVNEVRRYSLGAFVLLIICAAVLVPALWKGKFQRWMGFLAGGLYAAYLAVMLLCFGA